jgi:Tol biopolymer transport system component
MIRPDGSELHDELTGPDFPILQDPEFSPDGQSVAFDSNFQFIAVHRIGSGRTNVLNVALEANPTWTPDSKQVVFDTNVFARSDVVVARGTSSRVLNGASGDGTRVLYGGHSSVELSPDGSQLLVLHELPLGDELSLWRSSGRKIRTIPIPNSGKHPWPTGCAWAPDGKRIVVTELDQPRARLVVMDTSGKHRVVLRRDYIFRGISWGGGEILFLGDLDGYNLIHPDGSHLRRLHWLDRAEGATISPDGRFILYKSGDKVYVAQLDGSGRHLQSGLFSATWSSDSRQLVFPRDNGIAARGVNATGKPTQLLSDTVPISDVSWAR